MILRRQLATLAALTAMMIPGGCGSSPTPDVSRYLLEEESPAPVAAPAPGRPGLLLARVDVASHLEGITVVRASGLVDTYEYHRWAAPVPEMVGRQVRERLLARGAFRFVLPPENPGAADFALRVAVQHLEIRERADQEPLACVTLDWTLTRELGREVVASGRSAATAPAAGRSIGGAVAALRQATAAAIADLAAGVVDAAVGRP